MRQRAKSVGSIGRPRFDAAPALRVPGNNAGVPDVRLVTRDDEFAALRTSWNAIAEECASLGVFAAHEWFDAAWQWRRASARLWILCLHDAGRLIAVLPLVVSENTVATVRVRELAFLTVPDTQVCDVIARATDMTRACAAFADEIHRRSGEWDVLRLKFLPPFAAASTQLREAMSARGLRGRVGDVAGNAYIALDGTWEAYYATRGRRLKKANNLAANRLAKAGRVAIEYLPPTAASADVVDRFVALATAVSARSWKRDTGNALDQPGPQAFFRRLAAGAAARGFLSIWVLTLDERPAAMELQLMGDGRVHALRSDFDAELEAISPGSHLNRCLLERLFGCGLARYYMGPGDNAYKLRWTDDVEPVQEFVVYGHTLAGRAIGAWEGSLKPLARRVRDRLRPPARVPAEATVD